MSNQPVVVRDRLPDFLDVQKKGKIAIHGNGRLVIPHCGTQPCTKLLKMIRHNRHRKRGPIHGYPLFQEASPIAGLALSTSASRHRLPTFLAENHSAIEADIAQAPSIVGHHQESRVVAGLAVSMIGMGAFWAKPQIMIEPRYPR
jgi:hypothetical protein